MMHFPLKGNTAHIMNFLINEQFWKEKYHYTEKTDFGTSMVTVHFSMKQIFLLTSSFVFSPSAFRMMKQSISAGWNLGSDTVNCNSCRIWPLPLSFKIFCQVPITKIYYSYLFESPLIKSFIDISYLTYLIKVCRQEKKIKSKNKINILE